MLGLPSFPRSTRWSSQRTRLVAGTLALSLLAAGSGIGEVAEALVVSRNTARKHVQAVLMKLGAHTQLEAVAIARREGLL